MTTIQGVRIPGASEFGRTTAIELAQLAEENSLETVWVGESWGQSSVPLLTQILDRTDRIEACSGIFNIYSRTPALIAMEAYTLSEVSNGRVRIGLGTSSQTVIEELHGVSFDKPLRRTREYIEIIRAYLTGEPVEYNGELFELSGFGLDIEQEYDVPIYVAAMGERNRQLVGEYADGWIPLLIPHTAFDDALSAVDRGANRAGRSMDDMDIAPWIPTCISEDDPDAAVDAVRSLIAFYVGAMGDYYAASVGRSGYTKEAELIKAGWRANNLKGAKQGVSDEMVQAFGACGTVDDAMDSLASFDRAGVDSPIAYVPSRWTSERLVRETFSHLN